MCMIIMTLVNDCQMFKLRCPEWKLAKDIRRLPFSEGIKCYIITYIYTVLESTTVYTLYTGLPANLKTLLYLDLQQNAIFCLHMLLLYHNFIALNENHVMSPFSDISMSADWLLVDPILATGHNGRKEVRDTLITGPTTQLLHWHSMRLLFQVDSCDVLFAGNH